MSYYLKYTYYFHETMMAIIMENYKILVLIFY